MASTYPLPTKEERQIAKLNLAQSKRQAINTNGFRVRNSYDISLLPSRYIGNVSVPNPHPTGLQPGRPWVSGSVVIEGLWRNVYAGYYPTTDVFSTDPISSGPVDNLWDDGIPQNTTYEYKGYIRANYTGTWYFTVTADDAATLWVGPTAFTEPMLGSIINFSNNSTATGSVDLIEGNYYPIRLLYGNDTGNGLVQLTRYNGLTASRVISLDAAVHPEILDTMFSVDNGGIDAGLMTPGVVKTAEKGGIVTFAGTTTSGTGTGFISTFSSFNADFTLGLTVSVWANIATGASAWARLIDFGNGPSADNIIMGVSGYNPTQLFVASYQGSIGGNQENIQMCDIAFNQWKLYTWTADGTNYKLYIDDQLITTYPKDTIPTGVQRSNNYIGGSNWPDDPTLKGSIASVEMYSKALSEDEIIGLYNQRKGRFA